MVVIFHYKVLPCGKAQMTPAFKLGNSGLRLIAGAWGVIDCGEGDKGGLTHGWRRRGRFRPVLSIELHVLLVTAITS